MAIISTNTNPNNDSKYARHRSIFKGRVNQLRATVDALKATAGMTVHEYDSPMAQQLFQRDWGSIIGATREMGLVRRHWESKSIAPAGIRTKLPQALQGDFRLIWDDFSVIGALRLSQGAEGYSGHQLILVAWSGTSFDLVFSKYGYADNTRRNHHFFHWQARLQGVNGAIGVDDYLAAA